MLQVSAGQLAVKVGKAYIQAIMLTPDEIERYKRQLVLKEIGGEGQQKLKAARVLVVGAGGLGLAAHSLSRRCGRWPDRHHR